MKSDLRMTMKTDLKETGRLFRSIQECGGENIPSVFERSSVSFSQSDNFSEVYNGRQYYCLVLQLENEGYIAVCGDCFGETGSGDSEVEAIADLAERISSRINVGHIFDPSSAEEQKELTKSDIDNLVSEGFKVISKTIASFKLKNIK